jgi:hypothetical protein
MAIVGYFVGVGILHLVATLAFGAKGDFMSLLRAESHAAIIGWVGIILPVGAIVGLWHLPVSVVILQNVYGMPRKARSPPSLSSSDSSCAGLLSVMLFRRRWRLLMGMRGQ